MNGGDTPSLRLFFALWPDDATRARLQQLQATMHGRIVPYENLHLTLAFLGRQPAHLLPVLREMLDRLPVTSIRLCLDRIGYFPHQRIAWVGMHAAPDALHGLQRALAASLREQGITFDERNHFRPHVTLARAAALPPDLVFEPITWQADQLTLAESHSEGGGSIYRVLVRRALEEPARTADEAAGDTGAQMPFY